MCEYIVKLQEIVKNVLFYLIQEMDDNWSVRNIMNSSWILSVVNSKSILERLPYEIQ